MRQNDRTSARRSRLPSYRRRLRMYERNKRKLQPLGLTPAEYEEAIKALARRCGI